MPGLIKLTGIKGFGRHGVFDHERLHGQPFLVDVECVVDLSDAVATDNLSHTLDYGTLADEIVADIEGPALNLIEALAGRIAETCLAHECVAEVTVTVHKPQAPVRVTVGDIAVTISRRKQ